PLSAVVLDVRDRDRGSLLDEQPRGRFANTTRSSRDQRDFTAESVHVAALPSWLRIVTTPVANPLALALPSPSPASTSCPSRGTSSSPWPGARGPARACPCGSRACRGRGGSGR